MSLKKFGCTAKIHPKDGVSRLNFPERFDQNYLENVTTELESKAYPR